jgi:hypothetical protein
MKKSLFILIISLLYQLNSYSQSLAGTWVFNDPNMNLTMLLNADGTGEFQGASIKYSTKNGQLYVDDGINPVKYNYKLTQNSLVLSGGGMQMSVTFTRPGSEQVKNSNNNDNLTQNQYQNQNKDQNQNVNQYNNQSNSTQQSQSYSSHGSSTNIGVGVSGGKNGSTALAGLWQGPGGKMAFYPDGTMLYNSVSYNYSFPGNQLAISGNDGSLTFSCTLSGNSLNLSQNGNSAQYTKIASMRPESVDPQLVGKWCIVSSSYNNYSGGGSSSEECITLNADGTYSYSYSAERSGYSANQSAYGGTSNQNGDQGTWKSDGITITSVSRTTGKTSRYSFSKENNENGDPMIVIGGKKFVTAYNRPKWQ